MDSISLDFNDAVNAAKVCLVKLKVHILKNIKNNFYIKENFEYLLEKVEFMAHYIEIREITMRSMDKTEATIEMREKCLDEIYHIISLIIDLDDNLKKIEK